MRIGTKQVDSHKALLVAFGVLILAVAIVVEQGFKDAGYYATVMACVFLNALFLANPLRFLKDLVGLSFFVGMVIANGLLFAFFDAPVLFLLILWLPAIAGVLVGFWVRSKSGKQ